MTQQEYEQKKRERWDALHKELLDGEVQWQPVSRYEIFSTAFDRAYALGKQTETISQEEIEEVAKKYAAEVDKNVCDLYGIENPPASLTFGECAAESFREGVNFALGKQAKDAEETPITERLYEEEKSQLEWLYYYLNRAADKQENESVSVAILFEAMERLEDMFGVDLLTNGHGKNKPKDADTVIQGWVARSNDGPNDLGLRVYTVKPDRIKNRNGWNGHGEMSYLIDCRIFPDLSWESDPLPVELIIKRKKNG